MGIQVGIYMLQCSNIGLSVQWYAVIRAHIHLYIYIFLKNTPGWLGSSNTDLPQIQKHQLRSQKIRISTTPFR